MSKSEGMAFDPRYPAMVGWIMLHGFCSLMMSGLLPPAEGMSREMLLQVFLRCIRREAITLLMTSRR